MTSLPFAMMQDFVEGAIAVLEDCSDEVRDCLSGILVKGFAYVKITQSFREIVSESFGVSLEQIQELADEDIVRLGLPHICERDIADSFRFHASLVDRLWKKQLTEIAA